MTKVKNDNSSNRISTSIDNSSATQVDSSTPPNQSPLTKNKSLARRIAHTISSALSGIGAAGIVATGVLMLLSMVGVSFCAPIVPVIIGLVATGINLIGMIIDVADRATDEEKYAKMRNTSLGIKIVGRVACLIALSLTGFAPIAGAILFVAKTISTLSNAISAIGSASQLVNDHRNNRILTEYGDNKLGRFKKWFLDLLFGVPGQPPQTITSPADDEPGKIESN